MKKLALAALPLFLPPTLCKGRHRGTRARRSDVGHASLRMFQLFFRRSHDIYVSRWFFRLLDFYRHQ
jgi:hypothetical protein